MRAAIQQKSEHYKSKANQIGKDLDRFSDQLDVLTKNARKAAKFAYKHPYITALITWGTKKALGTVAKPAMLAAAGMRQSAVSDSINHVIDGKPINEVVDNLLKGC